MAKKNTKKRKIRPYGRICSARRQYTYIVRCADIQPALRPAVCVHIHSVCVCASCSVCAVALQEVAPSCLVPSIQQRDTSPQTNRREHPNTYRLRFGSNARYSIAVCLVQCQFVVRGNKDAITAHLRSVSDEWLCQCLRSPLDYFKFSQQRSPHTPDSACPEEPPLRRCRLG